MEQMPLIQLVTGQAIYKFAEELLFSDKDKWSRVIKCTWWISHRALSSECTGKEVALVVGLRNWL